MAGIAGEPCYNYRCFKREDKPECKAGCSGFIDHKKLLGSTCKELDGIMARFKSELDRSK